MRAWCPELPVGTIVRPVKGLDKPVAQWMIVATSVLLVVLLVSATLAMRRSARRISALQESQGACKSALQSADAQLAKERAAREAFSLELARVRAERGSDETSSTEAPTLTLFPQTNPGPLPPDASGASPGRAQAIQLRLMLPAKAAVKDGNFQVAARDWSTGRALWSTANATTGTVEERRAVIAHVTGEMLGPGSYEIAIVPGASNGVATEPMALYELTLNRRKEAGGRR